MSCSDHLLKIILIVSLFLVFTGTASADINIVSAISDGFVRGFDKILFSVTDQMYDSMGLNSTNSTTMITNFMIQPDAFLSNKFVQKEKSFTAFWFAIFYVIFLLVGGIILMKEEAMPARGFGMGGPAWRNTYIAIALIAPLVWAFYLYSFKWIFSLEYLLSKSAYFEIIDFIPPTSDNAIAYIVLGMMRIINILFFYIRYLVVGLIAGWFLFVLAARFIPITAIYGKLIINYGLLMLFSRFVVVLIFLGGFGIAQDLPGFQDAGQSVFSGLQFAPYFIVLLLALLFELACVLYPIIFVFFHSPVKYIKFR
jgi:hypothetical protein